MFIKKYLLKLFLYCFILSILIGCNGIDIETSSITRDLEESSEKLETGLSEIRQSSDTIKDKTNIIYDLAESPFTEGESLKIKQEASSILSELDNIYINLDNIDVVNESLHNIIIDVKDIDKQVARLERERDEALKQASSTMQKILQSFVVVCVIGFGISIAIFFLFSPQIGLGGAIGTIAAMSLALTVSEYLLEIALVGFVLFIAGTVYFVYQMIKQRKTIKELIFTTELSKIHMPKKEKDKMFGTKNHKGEVDLIQSKGTNKIVQNEKKNLPKLWDFAKEEHDKHYPE